MSFTVGDWDNDYSRASRSCTQIRSNSLPSSQESQALNNLVSTVERLELRIKQMEAGLSSEGSFARTGSHNTSRPEISRRKSLVVSLRMQVESLLGFSGKDLRGMTSQNMFSVNNPSHDQSHQYSNSVAGRSQQQHLQSNLAMQDNMIDELAAGVGRLKHQTQMIGEEGRMHVRLLNEMDVDVERATVGFQEEAKHAERARQQTSVKKLYSIIAGLSILLLFLLSVGFS